MIEQHGRITRLQGPRAWVSCRPVQCRACEAGHGCGAGLFARFLSNAPREFPSLNPHALPVNCRVVVGVGERQLLSGAVRLYGWPLLGLLGGVLLGALTSALLNVNEDLLVLLGALSGGTLVLLVRGKAASGVQPVVLRPAD